MGSKQETAMRAQPPSSSSIRLKLGLILLLLLSLVFFVFRSGVLASQQNLSLISSLYPSNIIASSSYESSTDCPTCKQFSPSLANALVHYATSNITPQQTFQEISLSLRVLEKKSPCNFLVFGLGHDSLMWKALNPGGRTVFLEEDKSWIELIKAKNPNLESYHVVYNTKLTQADELRKVGLEDACKVVGDPRFSRCQLVLRGVPNEVYDVEWDVIMIDAPTAWHDEAPGRMGAIYTAGLMARNRGNGETEVFLHDVDRVVEDKHSKAFLCKAYLIEQEGRIRHFTIPSHRARISKPFCP